MPTVSQCKLVYLNIILLTEDPTSTNLIAMVNPVPAPAASKEFLINPFAMNINPSSSE